MLKRTISGSVYVAVLVGFFLLRQFVDHTIFHILMGIFLIMGTFELARMLKPFILKGWFWVYIAYSIVFFARYLLIERFYSGWAWLFSLSFAGIMIIITSVYALIVRTDRKTFLASLLPFIYPALFLLTMLLANDMLDYGFIALLLAFVISPLSDTFAYLVGSSVGGPKLCPKLSPKKTWSGAIGGLIGGAVGSVVVYFIFTPEINFFSPVLLFILIGLVASVINIIGDLFESYIKRKAGVKDSGKIIPGHGGILDRIDGTMFTIVFIYIVFLLL